MTKTANYDMLIQLNEKVLNKALAMVFYNGFLNIEGEYKLIDNIPEDLHPFTQFRYKVNFKSEPFLDFRGEDKVFMRFSAELIMYAYAGIRIEFDLDFLVRTNIVFDLDNRKMTYQLKDVDILKIVLNDKLSIHQSFINKLNTIMESVLSTYFAEVKELEIPLALHEIELPEMPNDQKLPVSNIDVKVLNRNTLVAGVDFFTATGSLSDVEDLTQGKEFYIGIKESALKEIYDYWWEHTTYDKCESFSGETSIGFDNAIEKTTDTLTRILSLGFLESDTDYENIILKYGGKVALTKKPEFEFLNGNLVEISNLEFLADIHADMIADVHKELIFDKSSFIPDDATKMEDDITLKPYDAEGKTIFAVKDKMEIKVAKASGILTFNSKNNIAIKIIEADFEFELQSKRFKFAKVAWIKLMDFLRDKIMDKIPEIVVSPNILLANKNVYGYTCGMEETQLTIEDEVVTFNTDIVIDEIKGATAIVPTYIANAKSRVVHKFDCPCVSDIAIENRVGYFVIYEALHSNYKACEECLRSYHIV